MTTATINTATAIAIATVPATEKTFTVAGVSNLKGVYKARFANSLDRVKVLHANAHTDIRLIELPHAMVKADAVQYLLNLPFNDAIEDEAVKKYFDDVNALQAFEDFMASKTKATVKTPRAKKAAAAPVTVTVDELLAEELVETPVDLTKVYESVGLEPPTVYDDAELATA
jgi:pyruvate-formate lyase